jgi:hypothetical protein
MTTTDTIDLPMPINKDSKAWGVTWMEDSPHWKSDAQGLHITYPTNQSAAGAGFNMHYLPPELKKNPVTQLTITYDVLPDAHINWRLVGKLGCDIKAGDLNATRPDPATPNGNRFVFGQSAFLVMWESVDGGKTACLKAYVAPSSNVGTYVGGKNSQMVEAQGPGFTDIASHLGQNALISLFMDGPSRPLKLVNGQVNSIVVSFRLNSPGKSDGGITLGCNNEFRNFEGMCWLGPKDTPYHVTELALGTWFGGQGPDFAPPHQTHITFSNYKIYPDSFVSDGTTPIRSTHC